MMFQIADPITAPGGDGMSMGAAADSEPVAAMTANK